MAQVTIHAYPHLVSVPGLLLPKGQVTIPIEARREMKLDLGDYVVFEEENGKLMLSKAVLRKT